MNPTPAEVVLAARTILTAAKSSSSSTDDLLSSVGPPKDDVIATGPLPFAKAAEVDQHIADLNAALASDPAAILTAARGALKFFGLA